MHKAKPFAKKTITEGSARIFISSEEKISKKLPVFYNPIMKFNRDITILLLKQFPPMSLCDSLAGTGIRSIRFAKELKYKSITANDISKSALSLIKKNMRLNNVKFTLANTDANLLLLQSKGFDYIDLDVFGSPNFMLDSAVKRISRQGIIAVTATDTAPLAGTIPKACLRKYWAVPLRTEIMHEIGVRILIRKIQMIGAQYEKALIPVFSFSKDHYIRVFLKCEKGKKKTDRILSQHGAFRNAGPLWLGSLWDKSLVSKMLKEAGENEAGENEVNKFLKIIKEESSISTIGFYDIHKICEKLKLGSVPSTEAVIRAVKKKGFKASRTHFLLTAIRSEISGDDLEKIISSLASKSPKSSQ